MICADVCNDKEQRLDLDVTSFQPSDNDKTLVIHLPDVNGKSAGDYDIMRVTFKTTGDLGPVTVKIVDNGGNVLLSVSPESPCDFR